MQWHIVRYAKDGAEEMIDAVQINASLLELQDCFGLRADDPGILCVEITEIQKPFLESKSDVQIALDKHSYFLEASATEKHEALRFGTENYYLPPLTLTAFPDARRIAPKPPPDA